MSKFFHNDDWKVRYAAHYVVAAKNAEAQTNAMPASLEELELPTNCQDWNDTQIKAFVLEARAEESRGVNGSIRLRLRFGVSKKVHEEWEQRFPNENGTAGLKRRTAAAPKTSTVQTTEDNGEDLPKYVKKEWNERQIARFLDMVDRAGWGGATRLCKQYEVPIGTYHNWKKEPGDAIEMQPDDIRSEVASDVNETLNDSDTAETSDAQGDLLPQGAAAAVSPHEGNGEALPRYTKEGWGWNERFRFLDMIDKEGRGGMKRLCDQYGAPAGSIQYWRSQREQKRQAQEQDSAATEISREPDTPRKRGEWKKSFRVDEQREIVRRIRELHQGEGVELREACRRLMIHENTYRKWSAKFPAVGSIVVDDEAETDSDSASIALDEEGLATDLSSLEFSDSERKEPLPVRAFEVTEPEAVVSDDITQDTDDVVSAPIATLDNVPESNAHPVSRIEAILGSDAMKDPIIGPAMQIIRHRFGELTGTKTEVTILETTVAAEVKSTASSQSETSRPMSVAAEIDPNIARQQRFCRWVESHYTGSQQYDYAQALQKAEQIYMQTVLSLMHGVIGTQPASVSEPVRAAGIEELRRLLPLYDPDLHGHFVNAFAREQIIRAMRKVTLGTLRSTTEDENVPAHPAIRPAIVPANSGAARNADATQTYAPATTVASPSAIANEGKKSVETDARKLAVCEWFSELRHHPDRLTPFDSIPVIAGEHFKHLVAAIMQALKISADDLNAADYRLAGVHAIQAAVESYDPRVPDADFERFVSPLIKAAITNMLAPAQAETEPSSLKRIKDGSVETEQEIDGIGMTPTQLVSSVFDKDPPRPADGQLYARFRVWAREIADAPIKAHREVVNFMMNHYAETAWTIAATYCSEKKVKKDAAVEKCALQGLVRFLWYFDPEGNIDFQDGLDEEIFRSLDEHFCVK